MNFPYLYSALASESRTQPWSTSSMLPTLSQLLLTVLKNILKPFLIPRFKPRVCSTPPTCNTSAPLYLVTTIQPSHLIPSPIFCVNVKTLPASVISCHLPHAWLYSTNTECILCAWQGAGCWRCSNDQNRQVVKKAEPEEQKNRTNFRSKRYHHKMTV